MKHPVMSRVSMIITDVSGMGVLIWSRINVDANVNGFPVLVGMTKVFCLNLIIAWIYDLFVARVRLTAECPAEILCVGICNIPRDYW